jgi:hypothetical protein
MRAAAVNGQVLRAFLRQFSISRAVRPSAAARSAQFGLCATAN